MGLRKTRKKQGMLAGILSMFGGGQKKSNGKKSFAAASPSKGAKSGSSPKGSKASRSASSDGETPVRKAPRRPAPVETPKTSTESFDEELFGAVGIAPEPEPVPSTPPPAPVFKPSVAPPPEADGPSSLFPDGVDDSLDALFDSFESGGTPPPPPQPAPPRAPVPPMPPPIQQSPPAAPPRPATPPPPMPPSNTPPRPPQPPQAVPPVATPPVVPGAAPDGLVSIGKLLIDQSTLKRIIDKAEKSGAGLYTTTKVITASKGQDIDSLLAGIDTASGVSGSLVVGRDGLVIASTLPQALDRELVGAIASSLFSNSDIQCKKMNMGGLHQAILETEQGVLVMLSIDVGVLVVLSQDFANFDLTQVLLAINAA